MSVHDTSYGDRLRRAEHELAKAHRSMRWCALISSVCILFCVMFMTIGIVSTVRAEGEEPSEKIIRANGLVIEDHNGQERFALRISTDGDPMIRLYDKNAIARAGLALTSVGPHFYLSDEHGKSKVILGVTDAVGPDITVADSNGVKRLRLSLFERRDAAALTLSDGRGELQAFLRADRDGSSLSLCDNKPLLRARLAVDTTGASLSLADVKGIIRGTFGACQSKLDDGTIQVYHESAINLMDGDAKIIWRAPDAMDESETKNREEVSEP